MQADYYSIAARDFGTRSRIEFNFVDTFEGLCAVVARELVDRIKMNVAQGRMTKAILPIGPLDYRSFARLCNSEGVSCESLVVFSMDEYCGEDGAAIPVSHPLSFRSYYQRNLLDLLDEDKKLPPDQLILPDPGNLDLVHQKIQQYGAIDVTYGGMGLNGHFAFNIPPVEEMDTEDFSNTTVRVVELSQGDMAQMAMGGTGGNLEIIPRKACTLGMKELLSAGEIHLTFMRSWHSGVLRRALFGPVTASFPGSLVQRHPNVRATITAEAAALPTISLLQLPGES